MLEGGLGQVWGLLPVGESVWGSPLSGLNPSLTLVLSCL